MYSLSESLSSAHVTQHTLSTELMSGLRAQFLLFHCWITSVLSQCLLVSPSVRWWTATLILSTAFHHTSQLEWDFSFSVQTSKHYAVHFCNSRSSFFTTQKISNSDSLLFVDCGLMNTQKCFYNFQTSNMLCLLWSGLMKSLFLRRDQLLSMTKCF